MVLEVLGLAPSAARATQYPWFDNANVPLVVRWGTSTMARLVQERGFDRKDGY